MLNRLYNSTHDFPSLPPTITASPQQEECFQDEESCENPASLEDDPHTLHADDETEAVEDDADAAAAEVNTHETGTTHRDSATHICKESKQCKKSFKTENGLKNHILLCHKPLLSFNCQESFKRKLLLNKHMAVHRKPLLLCNNCSMTFKSEYRLKQHKEQYHTETAPQCHVCGKVFENRVAQRNHNKTCFKKENKAKLRNKENMDPSLSLEENSHLETYTSENQELVSPGIFDTIPVSSEDSPTLVEEIPSYQILSFSDF